MTQTEVEEQVFSDLILDYMIDGDATDPFDDPCEAKSILCPNVAAFRLRWGPAPVDEPCRCGDQRLCVTHKDATLGRNNPTILWRCPRCDGLSVLRGVTSLR